MTPQSVWRGAGRAGRAVALAVGSLAAGLPAWSYVAAEPSLASRVVVVLMALAAAAFPRSAFLVCAGMLPLGGVLASLLGSGLPVPLTEPLVLAFLAGAGARLLVTPGRPLSAAARSLLLPVLAFAAVTLASGVVELVAVQPGAADPGPFTVGVLRFLWARYFLDQAVYGPLAGAMFVIEGLALFAFAVVHVSRRPAFGGEVIRMAAVGGAAVAAMSVVRLTIVVVRTGTPWVALKLQWPSIRISAAFPDFNAAGSLLAMALLTLAGLALAAVFGEPSGRLRRTAAALPWLLLVPVAAAALWLTGSRVGVVAVVPAALALLPLRPRMPRRWSWAAAGGVALVVGVAVLALAVAAPSMAARFTLPTISGRSMAQAMDYRVETARAAVRMIADKPVFGVGVGMFHARSIAYFDPVFRAKVPRENAHNNFLQVFAELGVLGFAPFLWILAAVGWRVAAAWRRRCWPATAYGAAGGVAAFILTWLAGHPLLILEVAVSFWIVFGAVAGLAAEAAVESSNGRAWTRRLPAWATAAVATVAIVSIPVRGVAAVQSANLANATIGMSGWKSDEQGLRYRWVEGPSGQFYVPAEATAMRLPLRLAGERATTAVFDLEVRADGELASRIRIEGATWRDAALELRNLWGRKKYHVVRVTPIPVRQPGGTGVIIGPPFLTLPPKR